MNFVIIGAGSVGGYFGARLQQAGHSVTFLVRDQRKKLLQERGLRIKSPIGNAVLTVQAETSAKLIPKCDVVIVAVRNFDLESVLKDIAYLASKGARVISLLNGVEHVEKLQKEISNLKMMGGSAYIDSRLGEDGEIIHRSQIPKIALGAFERSTAAKNELQNIVAAFSSAGIKVEVMDDLLKGLWQKYLFVLLGSFTAVADAPIGEILANTWCVDTLRCLTNEFLNVAKSTGVSLKKTHAETAILELKRQKSEWTSLVYEDILNHRRSEIDSLWGYIVRKGHDNRLEIPLSTACYGILKLKEKRSLKAI
ncbi:MAG: ketopantoate reductase family protein [Conexivisphaerales archaeon]